MPRLARAVAVGFAHHITQRGNNRQDVFFLDDDRVVYLELLKEQADKYALCHSGQSPIFQVSQLMPSIFRRSGLGTRRSARQ